MKNSERIEELLSMRDFSHMDLFDALATIGLAQDTIVDANVKAEKAREDIIAIEKELKELGFNEAENSN